MSEKTPRLRPHEKTSMVELAKLGADMYHRPLNADQQRRLGQMSLTDGVPIIHEAPSDDELMFPLVLRNPVEHGWSPKPPDLAA